VGYGARQTDDRPGLAGVLEHLLAVDLETFAELDIGVGDRLLEQRLAIDQRQLS
jgi:hypothetical protein